MSEYNVRFRDPVHGFVHLSPKELKLVDSPEFQRLRRIKQLALTYLVYPGAMHTRFEHSLGVVELSTRAFETLLRRDGSIISASLKQAGLSPKEAKKILRLSALLHDVGHLPFSHAGEDMLPKGKKHENVTVAIILNSPLRESINKLFGDGTAEKVAILVDKKPVPPPLLLLRKLISDQFDADRMDYLLRDSHHCGVEYGNFDYLRLLETIRVKEGEEGGLELAVDRGGVHILEAMLLARYWMFAQVYYHKTRRIYDLYLKQYMAHWAKQKFKKLLDVLQYDDDSVLESLRADSQGKGTTPSQELARRILNRNHHRIIFETNDHADGRDVRDALKVCAKLESQFEGYDFPFDIAKGTIHGFYTKGKGSSDTVGDDFMVFKPKLKRYSSLTSESQLIQEMPRDFRVVRIYADANPRRRKEFQKFADKEWKELAGVRSGL